jgi:cytochrome c oxidase cbb3-type subunit 3
MNKLKLTTIGMLCASVAMAQPATNGPDMTFEYVWLCIIGCLLLVLLLLVFTLKRVVYVLKIEATGGLYETGEEELTFWEKLLSLKPLSAEKEVELDHNFDGIKELNNPIPFWFNLLFGVTIAVGVIYIVVYHVTGSGDLQAKEYETEVMQAEIDKQEYIKHAGNLIDENSVKVLTDASKIKEGEALFVSKCVVCHGDKGQGNVGPNLTDEYWLHGGDVQSVFKTIKYGVPSKGMVAWQNSLNGGQIEELASFILSLQGSNPSGAKEPQGEKGPSSAGAVSDSTTQVSKEHGK